MTADDIEKSITCEVTDSGSGSRDNMISSAASAIEKRTVIAKADDKQIMKGQILPMFTVTCSGFVYGDTINDVFTNSPVAAVAETVNGKISGAFPIALKAELKTEKNALYRLSKYDGTLTVTTPNVSASYYTITATAGIGGSISTGTYVSVPKGDSAGFVMIPDKGYLIADVKVDGKSVGAVKNYVFTNVQEAHTIEVSFKLSGGHVNPQTGVNSIQHSSAASGSFHSV